VSQPSQFYAERYLVRTLFLEAITAIHRFVAARLKRNFRGTTAAAARGGEHLTLAAAVTLMIHAASTG
jgi:hypothetical protein